jgi:hypothetical protein
MTDGDHPAKIQSSTETALSIAGMLMEGAVDGFFNPAQP